MNVVYVKLSRGPDERGRFWCLVNGYMMDLTLEQIKRHVADGDRVEEWK